MRVVWDVLENLSGDHPVEGLVLKGQVERVRAVCDRLAGRLDLARLGHRGHHHLDVREIGLVEIGGDDLRTAAQRLEGVAPLAAAEVEQPHTLGETETLVVDRSAARLTFGRRCVAIARR